MRLAPSTSSFTIILGICAGLPALSIDLSAPTLTILPGALGTTVATAGLTLSLFMVGFAAGQFVGGRSSDLFGRRPVLLASISVYVLSGLCCSFATTGAQLIAARLIQGLAAGACAVQAAAIVQDLFQGESARRKQSYVSVVLMIMPMLAPAIGAFFMAHLGWRSVHVVLAIAGVILGAILTFLLEESHTPTRRPRTGPWWGLSESHALLNDTLFWRLAVVNALSYGSVFAYVAGAPVVVMTDLHQPSGVYAAIFASTAIALSGGAYVNASLGHRGIAAERVLWPALLGQAVAAVALVLAGTDLHHGGIFAAFPALLVCIFARGLLSPNLVHLAVSRHRDRAGLTSAFLGLMQLLVGALASAVVAAMLSQFGYSAVSVSMAALSCAAAAIWRATESAQRSDEAPSTN